jgi:CRISPR-associated endonuclease/helicase Cas3
MPSWAKLKAGHQLSLIDHSCDVASVLEAVLQQCSTYRRRLATSGGLDDLDGVQISRLSVLAFLHDYGKANRGFQNHQFRGQTPKMPTAGHVKEALVLVTHDACIDRFVSLVGWDKIEGWGDAMPSLLFASLSHHGDPVGPMKSDSADARWWDAQAFADLGALGAYAQEHWPEAWGSGGTPLPATPRFQHLFAGLVALADWVGSDLNFFPIYRPPHDDPLIWSRAPAATAVRAIGLASGRVPADAPSRFAAAFGFSPRALQERCEDIPLSQITVIEDETGSGKTEAALWLWRRLHDAGLVDGAYLALPTRSASTELHGRIQRYIREDLWGAGSPACVLAVPGYIRRTTRV